MFESTTVAVGLDRKLARLLAGGLLPRIHMPSPELEGARELVRAREDNAPRPDA